MKRIIFIAGFVSALLLLVGGMVTCGVERTNRMGAEISTVISDTKYDNNPSIFFDPSGNIHVFYRVGTTEETGTGISHAVSNNNGASWSISSVTLPSAPANYVPQNEKCVVLRNGTLAMFITMYYASGVPNQQAYFATSNDYGNSFSTWTLVPNTPFYSGSNSVGNTASDIKEGPNGEILMVLYGWLNSSDAHRSSVLYKSTDLGAIWTTSTIESAPSTRDFSETTLTSLVTGSNAVTLEAWIRDNANNKLWYATSTNDGATWSSVTDVTPPNYSASLPDVIRIGNAVMITYRTTTGGGGTGRAVTYANSPTGTWDSSEALYAGFYSHSHTLRSPDQNSLITAVSYSASAGVNTGTAKVVLRQYRLTIR